jgi:tetratricopeptide (TPR) repeat protein
LESSNSPHRVSLLLSQCLFSVVLSLIVPSASSFSAYLPAEKATYYSLSQQARKAYNLITSMRFAEAESVLAQIKSAEPGNAVVWHLENYLDCISVYVNEDPDAFLRLKQQKRRRMELLAAVDVSNPYARFAQADMRMQWAMAHLKFGEYTFTFSEVSKAHKLLRINQAAFPEFLPQQKNIALLQAIAGVIPDQYKWGLKMMTGLEGTIAQGRRAFESILQKTSHTDFLFETETQVLYALLLLHLANDSEAAWKVADELHYEENPLHAFVSTHIAMRTGHNDKAIEILEKCPRGGKFAPLYFLDFMHGHAKLRRLDSDAHKYFLAFLYHYKGRNFRKDALQKLAWHALLQSGERHYRTFMNRCINEGFHVSGSDKSAMREAESGEVPHHGLLRARLLFDGGYYQKALDILKVQQLDHLTPKRHRLEYWYRMGRIFHALERFEEALGYYSRTYQEGKAEGFFFACNARLQIGLIYEKQHKYALAKACFQECLGMSSDEYEAELHQKAKSGINRIGNAK